MSRIQQHPIASRQHTLSENQCIDDIIMNLLSRYGIVVTTRMLHALIESINVDQQITIPIRNQAGLSFKVSIKVNTPTQSRLSTPRKRRQRCSKGNPFVWMYKVVKSVLAWFAKGHKRKSGQFTSHQANTINSGVAHVSITAMTPV